MKPKRLPGGTQKIEHAIANLRQVVLRMEQHCRFLTFGTEGLDTCKIGVGEQLLSQVGKCLGERIRVFYLQFANDEETRAYRDRFAGTLEERGVTSFISGVPARGEAPNSRDEAEREWDSG